MGFFGKRWREKIIIFSFVENIKVKYMLFEIYFANIAVVLVLYYLLLTSLYNKLGIYSTIDPQRYHLLPN
jgi:hypothetical protein